MNFEEKIDLDDLKTLYRHWRAIGDGGIPFRSRFDPFALAKHMPHLFLMDVLPGSRFRYRLMGTALDDHLGQPFTGRYLDEMRKGRTLEDLTFLFSTVAKERRAGFYVSRLETETKAQATYRRLLLPLAEPDGSIAILLGDLRVQWGSKLVGKDSVTLLGDALETGGEMSFESD